MKPELPAIPKGYWPADPPPERPRSKVRRLVTVFGVGGYVGLLVISASLPAPAANFVRGAAIAWFLLCGVVRALHDPQPRRPRGPYVFTRPRILYEQ